MLLDELNLAPQSVLEVFIKGLWCFRNVFIVLIQIMTTLLA